MLKVISLVLVLSTFCVAVGCTGGTRRRRSDGGGVTLLDSGNLPGSDGGGIPDFDAGPLPAFDAGPFPDFDAGPLPGSDAGRDAGPGPGSDAGAMCLPDIVTAYPGQPCPSSVGTCSESCTTSACIIGCIDAGGEACSACADQNITACFNEAGCQPQWNCFATCITVNDCLAQTDPRACVVANCSDEDADLGACYESLSGAGCGSAWGDCVAP